MTGLLDYIFRNLEEKELDKEQIIAYIRYLDEINLNGLPIEKELEYQTIKLKLLKRMNTLHQEQIRFYLPNQEGQGKKDNQ
jgi:hypothetical protein